MFRGMALSCGSCHRHRPCPPLLGSARCRCHDGTSQHICVAHKATACHRWHHRRESPHHMPGRCIQPVATQWCRMTDHHNTLEVVSLVLVHAAIAYGKISVAAARLDTLLKIAFWCFELEKAAYCNLLLLCSQHCTHCWWTCGERVHWF